MLYFMFDLVVFYKFVFEKFFLNVIDCCSNRFGRLKFVDLFGDVLFIIVNIFILEFL